MMKKNQPGSLSSRMRSVVQATPAVRPARTLKPRALRRDAFKRGILVLETGQRIDVVVRNLSEAGARIEFYAGGGSIAGHVTLMEPSLGLKKPARVIWKDQNSAGLVFEQG